jgi:putative radical SAM enzyme (TIGR03279 family)
MQIRHIEPDSPLYGHVRPGYKVVSVNGSKVLDEIDFRFRTTDERVDIVFADLHGRELEFTFDDYSAFELGIALDDRKIKLCKNDCIFCFVLQQPQRMRRSLYLKDEDYRLSFTHGNFITLSNTTEKDLRRIVEQRLSPLYVSVHATDDTLRRCMLRNELLAPIVPRLQYLSENGIVIHTQVVLCPGVNDGKYLEKTVDELSNLHPGVETLAVVPVGLTRYRKGLASLRTYTADEAAGIIDYLEGKQKQLLEDRGTRFVWAADEFYVIARREFPRRNTYEEMSQFENGIGMAREFITRFNRRKKFLRGLSTRKCVLLLTGYSAEGFLKQHCIDYLRNAQGLNISLAPVSNRFWGESVTVSGLLTGQDLLREARKRIDEYDELVLPPNCLNFDDLFLDNMSLAQFQGVLKKPVHVGQYDMVATVRDVFQ